MPTFPIISTSSVSAVSALDSESLMMYPATTSEAFVTRVLRFDNDSEQTWSVAGALKSVKIDYSNVNGYDFGLIADFFRTQKGRYSNSTLSNTFSMTILGEVWNYCVFDQDSLEKTVDRAENYAFSLRIKQVRPG